MTEPGHARARPPAKSLGGMLSMAVVLATAGLLAGASPADAKALTSKGFYIAGGTNGCLVIDRVLWCSTTDGAREPWFARLPARGAPTARKTPDFEGVRPPKRSPRLRAPGSWRARGAPFRCRWNPARAPIVCRSTASGRSIRILSTGRILVR